MTFAQLDAEIAKREQVLAKLRDRHQAMIRRPDWPIRDQKMMDQQKRLLAEIKRAEERFNTLRAQRNAGEIHATAKERAADPASVAVAAETARSGWQVSARAAVILHRVAEPKPSAELIRKRDKRRLLGDRQREQAAALESRRADLERQIAELLATPQFLANRPGATRKLAALRAEVERLKQEAVDRRDAADHAERAAAELQGQLDLEATRHEETRSAHLALAAMQAARVATEAARVIEEQEEISRELRGELNRRGAHYGHSVPLPNVFGARPEQALPELDRVIRHLETLVRN